MKLTLLLCFISGIVFITVVIPILDSFTSLIITWFEAMKVKLSEKINDSNINMKKKAEELGRPKRVCGFALPTKENAKDDVDNV